MTRRWQALFPVVRGTLALSLSLGALWLALRRVALADLRLALAQADGVWVALALGSVAVNVLAKTLRWQQFCGQPGRVISFGRYLGLLLAGQALNWLYPARLGDLLRVQGIGEAGLGRAFAIGTLVAEKTFDTLAYAFLLVAMVAVIPLPVWLNAPVGGLLVLALVLGGGVGLLAASGERLLPLADRLIAWLPARIHHWASERLRRAVSSLAILQSRRTLVGLAGLTALAWATAIFNNWLVFQALRLNLPLSAAWLLLVALQAGITLPAVPGGIGIFEVTCVLVLGLWGVPETAAFGYGLVLHGLVMLPGLLLGLLYLGRWGVWPRRSV